MKVWVLLYNEGGYEGQTSIEAIFAYPPTPKDIRKFITVPGENKDFESRLWTILTTVDDNGWYGGYWVQEYPVQEGAE